MNGSSEREAISRRYADSETKEVSEIKDAKALRRKGDKFVSGEIAIGRHSERQRRNLAYYNLKQLQGIKINSTETDHASMPLGIFASKSVSDVGIASWNYFSLVTAIHIAVADMNFVTRFPS